MSVQRLCFVIICVLFGASGWLGAQFDPGSVDGLSLWLDASDLTSFDRNEETNVVDAWFDNGGSEQVFRRAVEGGNDPTWMESRINGQPGVDLDNTDYLIGEDPGVDSLLDFSDRLHFFAVVIVEGGSYEAILGKGVGDFGSSPYIWEVDYLGSHTGVVGFYTTNNTWQVSDPGLHAVPLFEPVILEVRFDASEPIDQWGFFINGASAGKDQGSALLLQNNQQVFVGRQGTGVAGNNLDGAIGDLLLYHEVLSEADRRRVGSYLETKYAIEGVYDQPVASFSVDPRRGSAPLEVTLDANASVSPAGSIESYAWDFGDGDTGEGALLTHTFTEPGRYTITLTITSDMGATGSASAEVLATPSTGNVAPWTAVDVSPEAPLVAGASRPSAGGCFRVFAGGVGIRERTDGFHFLHRQFEGDVSLTVRIDSVDWATGSRVGLMLRESLAPGSRHASIFFNNSSVDRYAFVWREALDARSPRPTFAGSDVTLPDVWMRMERQASELVGFYSSDGNEWTEIGRLDATGMGAIVLGGVAASSRDADGEGIFIDAEVCELRVGGIVPSPRIRRGDADVDGTIQLSDPVQLLNFLFLAGAVPACLDATDFDDNGEVDITDAIASLQYQFLQGPPPAPPGPGQCGLDPIAEDPALPCDIACD